MWVCAHTYTHTLDHQSYVTTYSHTLSFAICLSPNLLSPSGLCRRHAARCSLPANTVWHSRQTILHFNIKPFLLVLSPLGSWPDPHRAFIVCLSGFVFWCFTFLIPPSCVFIIGISVASFLFNLGNTTNGKTKSLLFYLAFSHRSKEKEIAAPQQ